MTNKFPTTLPDFRLTKIHRKLLKHARRRLKDGNASAICIALSHGVSFREASGLADKKRSAVSGACDELKTFIGRALAGSSYFHYWQRRQGIYDRPTDKVREDRIKWINYILENCEHA